MRSDFSLNNSLRELINICSVNNKFGSRQDVLIILVSAIISSEVVTFFSSDMMMMMAGWMMLITRFT